MYLSAFAANTPSWLDGSAVSLQVTMAFISMSVRYTGERFSCAASIKPTVS